MSERGRFIVDLIKEHFSIELSFDFENSDEYFDFHAAMPAETNFTFFVMSDWKNVYFSLPEDHTQVESKIILISASITSI
jgi:hypothetical protein